MLSGISSYLFGASSAAEDNLPQPTVDPPEVQDDLERLMTREGEEEWVLVDKAARSPPRSPRCRFRGSADVTPNGSSGRSTPVHILHPSLCESWLVTPPSCFTAAGSARSDPLENLLIEHPSMSVYSLGQRGGRGRSAGEESEESDVEEEAVRSQRVQASRPHPLAINTAIASRKVTQRSMQKAVKKHEQQRLARNVMQRNNRVQKHNNSCRRPRRSERMMQPSGRSNNRSMLH
ncbi:hypothetical protein CAPTEDRAFT_227336 [Capitella teleta]|uniref:Tumor protein p53-inducible nuclear protein 1 n=1 Tax=Capitella teleta TaxID=283909 RepID=R7UJ16_CAPTE|nr:hypothetical protein CAPTEDRAFT_227336 [Capitella teleta]|eukprot:ELU06190.1 hypothetical protein CAPTEDRAFT_227336 [Capitella teleta]